MAFLILGPHSHLTDWCEHVVSLLCQTAPEDVPLKVRTDSAQGFLRDLLSVDVPAVITTSCPDEVVTDAIAASGRPFILVAASPQACVAYLVRKENASILDGVRSVLTQFSSLVPFSAIQTRLTIDPEMVSREESATVARIAAHLNLSCSPTRAALIAEDAHALVSASAEGSGADEHSDWDDDDRIAIGGAVEGLRDVLQNGRSDRLIATRHFFLAADSGAAPLRAIDATGRSRLLIYGPFWSLPLGDWTARCVYSFSESLIGASMSIDVVHFIGGHHEMARTSFTVTSAGRLDVNVRFVHTKPGACIELRLFNDRAVFDGLVTLGYVEFSRNSIDSLSAEEAIKTAHFEL